MSVERRVDTIPHRNVVLIGMPGAGKSTLGVLLAKELGYAFIDVDLVMQVQERKSLGEILLTHGAEGFKEVEARCVLGLAPEATVIAPGGSIVYSDAAMAHLKAGGWAIWLALSFDALVKRLGDLNARGVVRPPGKTLRELYEERTPLYEHYADAVVDCDGRTPAELVAELVSVVGKLAVPGRSLLPEDRE